MKVVIIDYRLGNLFSVKQVCSHLGAEVQISSDKRDLMAADRAILPGVGAFGDAMDNLQDSDLVEPIRDFIASGKPFLGVCLGLQLLFTESEEFGANKGLNVVEGSIKRLPRATESGERLKVPQIQWNTIESSRDWSKTPLESCSNGDFMYFVHSYYVTPQDKSVTLSTTNYGPAAYCSSLIRDNVFACQFHPEKSGAAGVEIYRNWFAQ